MFRLSRCVFRAPSAIPLHLVRLSQLTHTDADGSAKMVDVSSKTPSFRRAVASATVVVGKEIVALIKQNQIKKGDVLTVAKIAGILGAKQTSHLIPLCHPLPIHHLAVDFAFDANEEEIHLTAEASTVYTTGVEMEAMTAVSVAALTIYDMCKAVSHGIRITDIRLESKTGGKSGTYCAPPVQPSKC
jgi:molybdenum cofactor biosynthesis protein MoaC